MTNFDSFKSFVMSVKSEMEDRYGSDVTVDRLPSDTEYEQFGLQRDDLYNFMIELPHSQEWVASEISVHIPSEVDDIPDRPHVPKVDISSIEPSRVVDIVDEYAPPYKGEFSYDE